MKKQYIAPTSEVVKMEMQNIICSMSRIGEVNNPLSREEEFPIWLLTE